MRVLLIWNLHLEVWCVAPTYAQRLAGNSEESLLELPGAVTLAGEIDLGDSVVAEAHTVFPDIPVVYVHRKQEAHQDKLEKCRETCRGSPQPLRLRAFIDAMKEALPQLHRMARPLPIGGKAR